MASKQKQITGPRTLLKEPDLLAPSHDEILLWLDHNITALFGDESHWQWNPREVNELRTSADKTVKEQIQQLDRKIRHSERRREKSRSRKASSKELQISKRDFASAENTISRFLNKAAYDEREKRYVEFDLLTTNEAFQTASALKVALTNLEPTPAPFPFPGIIVETKQWQVPVSRHEYDRHNQLKQTPPHAFIDLVTRFRRPTLNYTHYNVDLLHFRPDKPTFGQWQIRYTAPEIIYFDVRAAIPSIGALIREIKFLLPDIPKTNKVTRYQVVSPTATYEDILWEQEIYFLKYEANIEAQLGTNMRWCAKTNPGPIDPHFDKNIVRTDSDDDDLDLTGYEAFQMDSSQT
jgi:hypothetical protein